MIVLAFLTDPEVVRKILLHLKLPTLPPLVAKVRVAGSTLAFPVAQGASCSSEGAARRREGAGRPQGTGEPGSRAPLWAEEVHAHCLTGRPSLGLGSGSVFLVREESGSVHREPGEGGDAG
jgi:hypothetical protein